ncbi:DNA cytosine methyltransferase [Aeromonas caviae]
MIYGSVCSGVEAASLAWEPLGWNPAWFAEIEPFPSAVLAHHWPHVTNLGDMTKVATAVLKGDVVAPDILVGGTPCQAFSVAGAREGLADDRGFLTIKYVELANAIDQKRAAAGAVPCITVWENVPGVLSSKDNAFGAFLGFLAGSDIELEPGPRPAPGKQSKVWGWCKTTRQHFVRWSKSGCVLGPQRAIAWRIIDAQYFGVAQRRRRVFVVASAREGFDPAKVLLEREGVRRDSAPSREAGKNSSSTAGASFAVGSHWDGDGYAHPTLSQSHNTGGIGASNQELFSQRGAGLVPAGSGAYDNQGQAGNLIAQHLDVDCIGTLTAGFGKVGAHEVDAYTCIPWASHVAGTLNANGKAAGSATQQDAEAGMLVVHGTQDPDTNIDLAHTLGRNHGQENAVLVKGVRRLTPVECERLQGFPDNHTLIPWAAYQKAMRKAESGMPITATASEVQAAKIAALYEPWLRDKSTEDCPDGPRYKAIGNSMARPCMEFIGLRIDLHLSEIDLPAVDEEAA